jgi:sigma-B regulation protein RsbU (phosphoserine phosphatase)
MATPNTPLKSLLRMIWMVPVTAIPFAILFGTMSGGTMVYYRFAYLLSLIFGYCIWFTNWLIGWVLLPKLRDPAVPQKRRNALIGDGIWHASGSILGATLASLIIHLYVLPGFLGTGRSIALMLMFTLLFTALFMGFSYASMFYRQALQQARSEQELNMARRIQRSFLLSQFPQSPKIEVHAINVSSREVSGDFYDVVPSGNEKLLLAIADVSGKGVPAALLSSMLQASLRSQTHVDLGVGALLANINELVCDRTAPEQFATFFLARVDETTMTMAFSNGGHNPPMLLRADGSHEWLEKGGTVLGFLPEAVFEEGHVTLRPGDLVIMFTDGVTEAMGAGGEMYGEARLEQLVRGIDRRRGAPQIVEDILEGLRRHLGGREAGDDVTVLVMRVRENDPATG